MQNVSGELKISTSLESLFDCKRTLLVVNSRHTQHQRRHGAQCERHWRIGYRLGQLVNGGGENIGLGDAVENDCEEFTSASGRIILIFWGFPNLELVLKIESTSVPLHNAAAGEPHEAERALFDEDLAGENHL